MLLNKPILKEKTNIFRKYISNFWKCKLLSPCGQQVLRLSIQKSSHLVGSEESVFSINLISVSLIKPLWPRVWKQAKTPPCLCYSPFRLLGLIIITPIAEFVISFTDNLHTTYLTQQELDQTFIATCKSMIDFLNLFVNKQVKCVSFYNNFANLPTHFLTFPWLN